MSRRKELDAFPQGFKTPALLAPQTGLEALSVSPVALHWIEGECHTAVWGQHILKASPLSAGVIVCALGTEQLNSSSVFALCLV